MIEVIVIYPNGRFVREVWVDTDYTDWLTRHFKDMPGGKDVVVNTAVGGTRVFRLSNGEVWLFAKEV